ncbi:MAG: CpsD/CapB family tyrosine-protein kinase [Desulfobacteraceae bacterium]|nr:CpsD/CapB family tyrosine-protein kinase [Desulfobacteraceae bacterium]MBC2720479.1 CpsD/CapB family tyrosine-protein kinase [Desulfobacteraceae bacterium]
MARTFEALEKSKSHLYKKRQRGPLRFSNLPLEARHQFEKLKSSIIMADSDQRAKAILFASYNHGEGTTTLATTFAESLAQDKKYKILLVDANTRSPGLDTNLIPDNLKKPLLFSDILSQKSVSHVLPGGSVASKLLIIPSGNVTYHPSQVFDHSHFADFIREMKEQFDFIIFDSSPLGRYYDTIVLATHMDGVILVVQAEKTPWYDLNRAKQMLEDKNVPVLGIVLNRRKFPIPRSIFQRFFA